MASFTMLANYRNKKIIGMALSGAEDTITVATNLPAPQAQAPTMPLRFGGNMPANRATVQLVSAASWVYYTVAGASADGYPVAANQPLTLTFQDGDVFYALGTGTLHAIVTGN